MPVQASRSVTGTATDPEPSASPAPSLARTNPLVVVLSDTTAQHVDLTSLSRWGGPVVVVGSVEEARRVLDGASPGCAPGGTGSVRGLRVDADRRRVVHADRSRPLTPLEFGVLQVLMRQPDRVLTYGDLTLSVWGTAHTGDSAHLHSVVRRLRRKLEDVRAPMAIAAVRGVGFRLAAKQPVVQPAPPRGPASEGPAEERTAQ